MKLILADDQFRDLLLPFVFIRPCADIRCGILTLRQKWEHVLGFSGSGSLVPHYLQACYPSEAEGECLVVNGRWLPDEGAAALVGALPAGSQLVWKDVLLAARLHADQLMDIEMIRPLAGPETVHYAGTPVMIVRPWDIFTLNSGAIEDDFNRLTAGRKSAAVSESNRVMNSSRVFLEEGAKVECSILNASSGPIYLGRDSEVMEGSMIRGPFSLGKDGVIKMGAKIYGATTIGPGAKAGGEISNSVIFGNSNKAHDGYLGNSVIGEWCNLGADTNNSNLKNNYSEVRVWSYAERANVNTGLQFCGLFMGDHSKCGINTMFNTGTVVGVFANIFGAGFPAKHLPSFTWGMDEGGERFLLDKALELAERVMARRNVKLTDVGRELISHLYLMQLRPHAED